MIGRPYRRGQSGNPGGRPKESAEIKALARQYGPEAIERLVALMRSDSGRIAVAAATALLDRAVGRATIEIDSRDAEVIEPKSDLELARFVAFVLARGMTELEAELPAANSYVAIRPASSGR